MLANDAIYWRAHDLPDAINKSWSSARGDYSTYANGRKADWRHDILPVITTLPQGRVDLTRTIDFGCGLGIMDEVLDTNTVELLMLDGNDTFISRRPTPLSKRCDFKTFSRETLDELKSSKCAHYTAALIINVLYHLDTTATLALSRALLELVRPGGHLVSYGYSDHGYSNLTATSEHTLFDQYPHYLVDMTMIVSSLKSIADLEFQREGFSVFRKRQP